MNRDTSAYIHFPWCLRKCPYCDFATRSTDPNAIPHEAYAARVERSLREANRQLDGRRLLSIFVGGGTPSLWEARQVGRVLRAVRGAFAEQVDDLEVTVECNPTSLNAEKAEALVSEGVTRFSLGVQSLSNRHLRYLGRLHDAEAARAALAAAQDTGARVSVDLMFGMPNQSTDELVNDLSELVERTVDHLSLYALTIEPGTQFGELHRKRRLQIAPEDDYANLYLAAEAYLVQQGFNHYEVSNYAREGAHSVHNQHYWEGGDYLGLGAGAVGCLTSRAGVAERRRNEPVGERWLAGNGQSECETLGPQEIIREGLMLGLRTSKGANLRSIGERAAQGVLAGRERNADRRIACGDLVHDGDNWRVPVDRWLRLDGIIADVF